MICGDLELMNLRFLASINISNFFCSCKAFAVFERSASFLCSITIQDRFTATTNQNNQNGKLYSRNVGIIGAFSDK